MQVVFVIVMYGGVNKRGNCVQKNGKNVRQVIAKIFSDLFCFEILDNYLKCSFEIKKWSILIQKWSNPDRKSAIFVEIGQFWFKNGWFTVKNCIGQISFVSRWINIWNAVESNSAESWKSHENLWSLIWVYKTLKLT